MNIKELKQSHNEEDTHKKAFTIPEQDLFENFYFLPWYLK